MQFVDWLDLDVMVGGFRYLWTETELFPPVNLVFLLSYLTGGCRFRFTVQT